MRAANSLSAPPATVTPGSSNLAEQAAFIALLTFLFLLFSRVIEFIPVPKTQLLLSIIILSLTFVTGRALRAFETNIGRLIAAFTVWLFACIPFSVWPGGSFHRVTEGWLRSFLVFIMICGIASSFSHCRQILRALALASLTIALLGVFMGGQVMGRLVVGNASLGNSNDLAQFLMVGLPFWFLLPSGQGFITTVLSAFRFGAAGLIVIMVLRTGSRGALLGIVAMALIVLMRLSMIKRLMAVMSALIILPVLYMTLSQDMRDRYMTMFASGDEASNVSDRELSSAVASKQQRTYLLMQSIRFTFTHPIFGVGPGQFSVASSDEAQSQGARGAWLETHNAFTQVSSESGIPGFLLYGAAMFLACRNVRRIDMKTRLDPSLANVNRAAVCMWTSLVGFLVTSTFSSIAYHPQVLVLLALCTVFAQAAESELRVRGALSTSKVRNNSPLPRGRRGGLEPIDVTRPKHLPLPFRG